MVLASYMLVGPTFLNYITRLLWQSHKLFLSNYSPYCGSCKMAATVVAICIGPSYRLVPVLWVLCHACTGRHSIKGLVRLALGSLFGRMWLREHLDLELETSPRHSPDCWFT